MTDAIRFILGDQLDAAIATLDGIDPKRDIVLMVEVCEEATYVRHHKQKIVLLFSAMRHFADGLRQKGFAVDYVRLDDEGNTGSFTGELTRAVERHQPKSVIVTEPGEWRVLEMFEDWRETLRAPVLIREDRRFIASRAEFARWAEGRKTLRMEFFYREMRRRTGLLMDGEEPEGGAWNFDHDNRKPLPKGLKPPARDQFELDDITNEVIALVERRFGNHFGLAQPFRWAVTREDALMALEHFVADCLENFGDFQDAMKADEDFVFHALISPYLNCGLLSAMEVCQRAERAYREGKAPLNAVEGFIRQILGWREYVRGIYWLKMPDYKASNALGASRTLPDFYWTAETEMRCLAQAIDGTRRNAYAHHIQRLMVTGNFALLAGIAPAEIEEWYLIVYADAYDWVELPNVHGMVMWADGGLLASKPYVASGAYIDRMSDYCRGCHYDPKVKLGEKACPFNYLYWNFLIENQKALSGNQRLAMPYRTLQKMDASRIDAIKAQSKAFLASLKSDGDY